MNLIHLKHPACAGLIGIGAMLLAGRLLWAQPHEHRDAGAGGLQTPGSLRAEHHHLHLELEHAIQAGGKTAEAAKVVQEVLHPHFLEEEKYAMPPLGLLPELAQGKVTPAMRAGLDMARQLRANYGKMLEEHKQITKAVENLRAIAMAEKKHAAVQFAEKLLLHAQNEEQVLYPATLLIGQYLELKLQPAAAERH